MSDADLTMPTTAVNDGEIISQPTLGQGAWVYWSFFWRSFLFSAILSIALMGVTFVFSLILGLDTEQENPVFELVMMLFSIPFSIYLTVYLPISAVLNKKFTDFRIALLPRDPNQSEAIEKTPGVILRILWAYWWRVLLITMGFLFAVGIIAVMVGMGMLGGGAAGASKEAAMPVLIGAAVAGGVAVFISGFAISLWVLKRVLNKEYCFFQVRFVRA